MASPLQNVYAGIDVACAAGKRLPVCFAIADGQVLRPLPVPAHLAASIPKGIGNRAILDEAPFHCLAKTAAAAIFEIANQKGWSIQSFAIDAPAAPPTQKPRQCEDALGRDGMSVYQTPTVTQWQIIRAKCTEHLGLGGSLATLPNANRIWMLFGFALFACLRARFTGEVIEVYPHSIVRALLPACAHKSTPEGYRMQLEAVAGRTGWDADELEAALAAAVSGSRHDRLDAFMSAWVASLPVDCRRAYGDPALADDAIWVPL